MEIEKLASQARSVTVRSLPIERRVRFATEAGVCDTLEGPVRYRAGDALVVGSNNEQWPITRAHFDAAYEPVGALPAGSDGVYRKMPRDGVAFQLTEPVTVSLGGGRGRLRGAPGDWVVAHGEAEVSVVAEQLFPLYYEVAP